MSQSSYIKYADALSLLKSMFINIDQDVIISILELNHGHLERSIDNLLSIDSTNDTTTNSNNTNTGNVNTSNTKQSQSQPVYVEPIGVASSNNIDTPFYKDANSYIENNRISIPSSSYQPTGNKRSQKNADYISSLSLTENLPDDFLRPPSWYQVFILQF